MISAAMIVRDEARGIRRALEGLRGLVDEVVVLDTGSEDDTPGIVRQTAEQWGKEGTVPAIRLLFEPWRDDFSHARNLAASRTSERCEWIVVLDGDEVLVPGDLRETIGSAPEEVDGVTALLLGENDRGVERSLAVRAYRKARCHWEYPVHNQLRGLCCVIPSTAEVHTSYRGRIEAKLRRSVPLLLACHERDPEDPHAPFYLAKSLLAGRDWAGAIRWCELCRKLCPDDPRYAQFWIWYAMALLATRGRGAARAVVDEGLAHHPGFADLWHQRMALDAAEWILSATDPGPYLLVASRSAAIVTDPARIRDGCTALELPLKINIHPPGAKLPEDSATP